MAFFDKREIVDLIHHGIRLEDDTGVASRVIRPPTKRSKYGGLPLNFRTIVSDDEDDEIEDYYTIPLYEDTSSTRELIAFRLQSRRENSEGHNQKNTAHLFSKPSRDLFHIRPLPTNLEVRESIISRNIDEGLERLQNPLNEYASFQGSKNGPYKEILILFTNDNREEIHRQMISVLPSVRVFQFIGLCFFKYFEVTGQELPGTIGDYELYMADEDEPVDTEFPEIDRSRLLNEVDFACMALVRKNFHREEEGINRKITIYFPYGSSYSIQVPTPDLPFSWLVNEVLKKRNELGENDINIAPVKEYNLEPVDQFDLTMDLSKPISSTICNEFVMIRKNSRLSFPLSEFFPGSRAFFHPRRERQPLLERFQSLISPMAPMSPKPRESMMFEFPEEYSCSPPNANDGERETISCYRVERLHRLKPKWAANLLFYWNGIEISPFTSEIERRRSFLPQQYQKVLKVSWEYLVNVDMSSKEKGNKETMYVLYLTWLPQPLSDVKQALSLPTIALECTADNWKTVQLECKSREDATEIMKYIVSMLQMRQSAALQAWNCSEKGQKRPSQAAEAAITALQLNSNTNETNTMPKKGKFKKLARLKLLLNSEKRNSIVSTSSVPSTPTT